MGIVITITFLACNNSEKQTKESFVMHGEIKGLSNGKIIIINKDSVYNDKNKHVSVPVKDGVFKIIGDYPSPSEINCMIKEEDRILGSMNFFAENTSMRAIGHADSLGKAGYKIKIVGEEFGSELKKYYESLTEFNRKSYEELGIKELNHQFFNSGKMLSPKEKAQLKNKIDQRMEVRNKQSAEFRLDYIRNNPASQVSVYLIEEGMEGKNLAQIESEISLLDASCYVLPMYARLMDKTGEMRRTEVTYDDLFPGISNISYKLDDKYDGSEIKDVIYLGVFSDNNLCAITKDAELLIINQQGEEIKRFKIDVEGKATTIAVDDDDNIYVVHSITERKIEKIRGRKRSRTIPKESLCSIFDRSGNLLKSYKLKGIFLSSGAKLTGKKLLVADASKKRIGIYNAVDGTQLATIESLRTCCGILDIDVRKEKQILATGLGGFNVVGYDFSGIKNLEFGQRGRGINDFHGCCNPVSLAYISNGAIVTVEKDPTRVKIYSQTGAKKIEGIEELVKGCSHIPLAIDSKDNLFLASAKKGIVKCVRTN